MGGAGREPEVEPKGIGRADASGGAPTLPSGGVESGDRCLPAAVADAARGVETSEEARRL